MDENAAPAPAAEAPGPDPMDAAVERFTARKEAAAAEGKAAASGGAPAATATASAVATAPTRPRAADIGALAQREWQARQREERAAKLEARYQPLDGALAKRDLKTALTTMAEQHGVTFADFVQVLTEAEPAQKTPAQVAEEIVAAKLGERDEAARKAQLEQQEAQRQANEAAFRTSLQEQAEKGAEGAPDRWELTAIAGTAGQAWDVIWGHYVATAPKDAEGKIIGDGERMTREQALDLIEDKLKQKREARRPKQETATGSGAGNSRNEAAGTQGTDGRAAAPSFTNRATSGMPAVVGAQPLDELSLPDNEAIDRIASRLGMRL